MKAIARIRVTGEGGREVASYPAFFLFSTLHAKYLGRPGRFYDVIITYLLPLPLMLPFNKIAILLAYRVTLWKKKTWQIHDDYITKARPSLPCFSGHC